jgi:hypothetical protein
MKRRHIRKEGHPPRGLSRGNKIRMRVTRGLFLAALAAFVLAAGLIHSPMAKGQATPPSAHQLEFLGSLSSEKEEGIPEQFPNGRTSSPESVMPRRDREDTVTASDWESESFLRVAATLAQTASSSGVPAGPATNALRGVPAGGLLTADFASSFW